MSTRTTRILLFLVAFFVASLSAVDGFAERTLVIKMGEAKCDKLSVSGKPPNGGYHVEEVWSQSQNEDVVSYFIDEDKGLICFEAMRVGSTKIRVRGQRYELDRYGKQKSSEPFYRSFKVRVRPKNGGSTGSKMY
ncbi:MAG: hypothetical protein KJP05_07795 [Deltaproteobacteria bacterium]|nr:hypothetical protein [Deltaproteobacteria bacterium]